MGLLPSHLGLSLPARMGKPITKAWFFCKEKGLLSGGLARRQEAGLRSASLMVGKKGYIRPLCKVRIGGPGHGEV